MKHTKLIILSAAITLMWACASIGNPDGGRYDDTPPRMVGSTPRMGATNVHTRKVQISFDEYIKLEKANEKVVVSPPQLEPANIRPDGKKIRVDLYDTLQANTTYTIDFSDAIEDNNEGNPMGHFTFSFSTGPTIDTMEVSGTVLNAENLEPVKGMLVGLYPADSTHTDSTFRIRPMLRVSRTNGSGRFVIKGVKPGSYYVYGLDDKDGDFVFSQKSEMLAWDTTIISPWSKPDVRMDTIWRDSLHYDSIRVVPYTHYMPDNIVLRAFLESGQEQHLLKTTREDPFSFTLFFTAPMDSLPEIKGLNFDNRCLVEDYTVNRDTVTYWVTDTLYTHQQDTLTFELTFMETDTTGVLVPVTDTLSLVPKNTYAKIRAEQQKQIDAWNKEREKRLRKAKEPLPYEENPYERSYLSLTYRPSSSLLPNQTVSLLFKEPILSMDTSLVRFFLKEDTLWVPERFLLLPHEQDAKTYRLYAEWEPACQYRLEVDSAAFTSVMGHQNRRMKAEFKVKSEEEFGAIYVNIIAPDTGIVVQLLNRTDKVVAQQRPNEGGHADFFYLSPGNYYLRCFIDKNGNGIWDTGDFDSRLLPEEVFYFPRPLILRAGWEMEQDWNLRGIEVTRQKPMEITKQKPDKEKSLRSKNEERDREYRNKKRKK